MQLSWVLDGSGWWSEGKISSSSTLLIKNQEKDEIKGLRIFLIKFYINRCNCLLKKTVMLSYIYIHTFLILLQENQTMTK